MLEYAVRPYQSPGALGKTIIPSTPGASRTRATLTWGAEATMPSVIPSGTSVSCCNEGLTEQTRETETVRISQAGKPENFIDVARAKSVKLKKKTKDNCAGDWDQFSGVGQRVADALSEFEAGFNSTTTGDADSHCDVKWTLNNSLTNATTAAP